jgi:hypothetical protein
MVEEVACCRYNDADSISKFLFFGYCFHLCEHGESLVLKECKICVASSLTGERIQSFILFWDMNYNLKMSSTQD